MAYSIIEVIGTFIIVKITKLVMALLIYELYEFFSLCNKIDNNWKEYNKRRNEWYSYSIISKDDKI